MPIKELHLDLKQRMKRVALREQRRLLSHLMAGTWSTMRKGAGMEFAGYRQYNYNDDASLIDWGASLRAKETLVKEFEEYKTYNIFYLLDVSDSMLFSSSGKLKAEYAAEMTFDLILAAADSGEAVGFGMFSDHFKALIRPNIGVKNIHLMMNALQNPAHYGGPIDMANVLKRTNVYLENRLTIIVIISDFIGFGQGWERYIKSLGQRFDILAIMVRDPRDDTLPKHAGQYYVKDPYSGQILLVDTTNQHKAFAKEAKKQEQSMELLFKKRRSALTKVYTNKNYFPVLHRFFKKTSRVRRH